MANKRSSVSLLPDNVRAKITELRDKGFTIDQIMEQLNGMGVSDVSRSAMGRHIKKQDEVADTLRRARTIAEGIGRTFGDAETSKVARTNVEILHALIMQSMAGADGAAAGDFNTNDLKNLATALEKASKASKTDFDQQLKAALEEERRATKEKAAEVAADTAKKQGLSKETVDAIKKSILGIE